MRDVRIRINDVVLLQTHPLYSAARNVVAKFKSKFEGPYRVLQVRNNNLVVWKEGKILTVNIDQVRFYHQRKSDENVIRVGNSDSKGLSYQVRGFEGVGHRSDWSQNRKNRGSGERRKVKRKKASLKEDQGERRTKVTTRRRPHVGSSKESLPQKSRRKKVRREEAAMPERDTSRYNLWSRRKIAEYRRSSGQIQDQGGPVWSRGKRYQEFIPYNKEQGSKQQSTSQSRKLLLQII
ncbi:uncharacterized protein TNCV_1545391 [Trichonephila clavipes]|nr:uncharacterized protein TNCV_1545391 [Trichonephila clavipes]